MNSSSFTESFSNPLLSEYTEPIAGLRRVGQQFWTRGWSLGTSSNYSVVVQREPLRLLVTASGKDKGHLSADDFVLVDEHGQRQPVEQAASSAETLLHCSIAKHRQAGAVLHTHSLWGTLLSERFFPVRGLHLEGFEMLKGLEGIKTHTAKLWLPIFDNTQDIPMLQQHVEHYWSERPDQLCWGYLIRKHGLYTWGKDLAEATRHMEVLEFLLQCVGHQAQLAS
jgi:methylthioribulose-1-phosphate dehydratase